MFISLPFQDRYFLFEMPLIDFIMFNVLKKNNPIGAVKYIEFDVFGCKNFHLAKVTSSEVSKCKL